MLKKMGIIFVTSGMKQFSEAETTANFRKDISPYESPAVETSWIKDK